ncbi:hypothetical protein K402DRAFT_458927 [Aulographum hederae CBS 113979]|uniref:Uncharacterized protein n=1 Tax=Aulographum hederae CBS 113979 TaxID=1176131 RepID=A0A6G1HHA7_9PEZI|nr:hypothetical protein K402DRAFT_458927 [Aulographum hederae CBS 113979]
MDDFTPESTPKRGGSALVGETPSKKVKKTRPIPTSHAALTPEDRMILSMKSQNASGKEIAAAWNTMTGETKSGDTIAKRIRRIHASLAGLEPEDEGRLGEAHRKAEGRIEREVEEVRRRFWGVVGEELVRMGGGVYSKELLEKQYKRLLASASLKIPDQAIEGEDADAEEDAIPGDDEPGEAEGEDAAAGTDDGEAVIKGEYEDMEA